MLIKAEHDDAALWVKLSIKFGVRTAGESVVLGHFLLKISAIIIEGIMCEKYSKMPIVWLLKTPFPTASIIKAGPAFIQ